MAYSKGLILVGEVLPVNEPFSTTYIMDKKVVIGRCSKWPSGQECGGQAMLTLLVIPKEFHNTAAE